jgi:bifunctional UDP-N-acetylglucosamine pyrophosphorylase/glucosamine-1-phosphate N-acetyltransferase
MLPVAGKPLLEHLLKALTGAGVREFIFVVGYRAGMIRNYFGSGGRWQADITYCPQSEQLGTAHALRQVEGLVGERFLVLNADVLASSLDIAALMGCEGTTLAVKEAQDASRLGVVEIENGRVLALHEKLLNPPTRLASTGIYLFNRSIFQVLSRTTSSPRGEHELPQAIQLLIDGGEPVGYLTADSWRDVSYPWELLDLNAALLADIQSYSSSRIEPGAFIEGACRIGEGTRVRAGSYISGPVVIGSGCDIGPNCYIRPSTSIGDNCRIGAAVEVKNCIIMSGSRLPHQNYAGDSVIGENCNLGAGTKIANLRLDGQMVRADGLETGRRKFGAVLGDDVSIGVNACLNPGAMVGNGVSIGPGKVVSGIIKPGGRIY